MKKKNGKICFMSIVNFRVLPTKVSFNVQNMFLQNSLKNTNFFFFFFRFFSFLIKNRVKRRHPILHKIILRVLRIKKIKFFFSIFL